VQTGHLAANHRLLSRGHLDFGMSRNNLPVAGETIRSNSSDAVALPSLAHYKYWPSSSLFLFSSPHSKSSIPCRWERSSRYAVVSSIATTRWYVVPVVLILSSANFSQLPRRMASQPTHVLGEGTPHQDIGRVRAFPSYVWCGVAYPTDMAETCSTQSDRVRVGSPNLVEWSK
jgi:hypothetical protein